MAKPPERPRYLTPRMKRLYLDYEGLRRLREESSIFDFEAFGDPPDRYIFRFTGGGFVDGKPKKQMAHEIELKLGAEYPRARPNIRWISPISHPNVFKGGAPCLGTFTMGWSPMVTLAEVADKLWDMARMRIMNPEGRGEWYELARQYDFPVDKRSIRDLAPRVEVPPGMPDDEDVLIIDEDAGICGLGGLGEVPDDFRETELMRWTHDFLVDEGAHEEVELHDGWHGIYRGSILPQVRRMARAAGDRLSEREEDFLSRVVGVIMTDREVGSDVLFYDNPRMLEHDWRALLHMIGAKK